MSTTGSEGRAGSSPMTRASRWVLAAAIAGSALAVGTAYTALQCVPMPIGWLVVIAPHNADVWSRALDEATPTFAVMSQSVGRQAL